MFNVVITGLLDDATNENGTIYETIAYPRTQDYDKHISKSGGPDNQLFEIDFKKHKQLAGKETQGTATLGPHSHNRDFAVVSFGIGLIGQKGPDVTHVGAQISLAGGELTNKNYILNFTRDHTVLNEEPIQMEINDWQVTLPAGDNQLDITKFLIEGENRIEVFFPGSAERDHGMKSMQLITMPS